MRPVLAHFLNRIGPIVKQFWKGIIHGMFQILFFTRTLSLPFESILYLFSSHSLPSRDSNQPHLTKCSFRLQHLCCKQQLAQWITMNNWKIFQLIGMHTVSHWPQQNCGSLNELYESPNYLTLMVSSMTSARSSSYWPT